MLHRTMIVSGLLCLMISVGSSAAEPSTDSKETPNSSSTEPKGVPIELKIVNEVAIYELDARGDPAFKFQENIRLAEKSGELISPTRVEMMLQIKNTGTTTIQVWVSGDPTLLTLDLKGTGPMTAQQKRPTSKGVILPQAVSIGPGKTHNIPLESLAHGFRNQEKHTYITELGQYQLSASFRTGVSPAPTGSKILKNNFGEVILKSAPIEFRVVRPS